MTYITETAARPKADARILARAYFVVQSGPLRYMQQTVRGFGLGVQGPTRGPTPFQYPSTVHRGFPGLQLSRPRSDLQLARLEPNSLEK